LDQGETQLLASHFKPLTLLIALVVLTAGVVVGQQPTA